MTAVTTEMTVFPAKDRQKMLSDDAIIIRVVDEGGGCFLTLTQYNEQNNTIRLNFSEWNEVVDAVRFIKAQYEMQGLL